MPKAVHDNSREALESLDLPTRHAEVFNLFKNEGRPLTDRMVKELLGYEDMDEVRPRITELIQKPFELLEEVGKVVCLKTKKTVRLVYLTHQGKDVLIPRGRGVSPELSSPAPSLSEQGGLPGMPVVLPT